METKVDIPYETDENKLIETLRGICLPAVRCLNRLSKEEKRRYAPYLIGGKDALIKLSILLYQNLFTPEVIEKLIESGEDLCRTYLVNSQKLRLRENSNLAEFKRQIINANNEKLIKLLLEFYTLMPEEEAELLMVRRACRPRGGDDKLMADYFRRFRIRPPLQRLLDLPEYSFYWRLCCENTAVGGFARFRHNCRVKWQKLVYSIGL
ncbi:MAG: hypothetical protein ACLSWJ_05460 [Alphaproteobacteria bacterium]